MPTGYSGTPLIKKLGIKQGNSILLVNQPDHYLDLLGSLPDDVTIINDRNTGLADFIHLFVVDEKALHNDFPPLKSKLDKNGMIWVSWIKKSSKMETDINGNDVRSLGLELGLVDIKVCAVDDDWSGLKFVYRKEDR